MSFSLGGLNGVSRRREVVEWSFDFSFSNGLFLFW